MSDQRSTWTTATIAVLIILAGLPLRWDLAQRLCLHTDEVMHFLAASEPTWADSWEASSVHTHPPLPFVLYHAWLNVGNSEWVLRVPSILAGAIAAGIAYLWLTRLTDRRAALVGVFLLTFSLPVLRASAQMRGYTFFLAFLLGALWFDERFRESGRVRHLLGETGCLVLALLTHYATAWVIGVLGLMGLVRAFARGLGATATRAWIGSQLVLASVCGWLYLTHVRGFVGGEVHEGLWAVTNQGNRFDESLVGRIKFAVLGGFRFLGSMSGELWVPLLVVTVAGIALFARSRSTGDSAESGSWRVEPLLLGVAPFALAAFLQAARIYPLGATRHSLWLMPFVALAVSAAARPLLAKPRGTWRIRIAAICLVWAWWIPYRQVTQVPTQLTPGFMQRTVAQLRSAIPRDELILTDEAGRLTLAYYLDRHSLDRGRDLGHGFREFHMDGYRIVAIPHIHFFGYSLRDHWPAFSESLGDPSTQPLWMVCMGFELPHHRLDLLRANLPPTKVVARHSIGDNHLLRVQFKPRLNGPDNSPSTAQGTKSADSTRGGRS